MQRESYPQEVTLHKSGNKGCYRGKRFAEACVIKRDRFGGGSVLVRGGIVGGNKTHLIVISGNINAQTYINDVLVVEALSFIQFHGPNATFMHDNARPHSAAITRQFLPTNNVNVLNWRRVRRNHAIHTVNDIAAALQAEWANLPALFIQHYVNSMRLRIAACIARNGGYMRY